MLSAFLLRIRELCGLCGRCGSVVVHFSTSCAPPAQTEFDRAVALLHSDGAGHAAALSGDRATSKRYFDRLSKMCARADKPGRPEVDEARR